jgi:hypothetical protein
MGCSTGCHSQERENAAPEKQGILVPESLEATGQDRTGNRSSQVRSSDESVPIQGSDRGYRQCGIGHPGLEHEEDRPSPQAKRRKASLKGDETGRIGEIVPEIRSHPQLSSFVKEQNNKKLLKTLFFRPN